MGSPSSRLNTRESLRPWLESGLEYLLCPGGLQGVEELPVQVQTSQSQQLQPTQPPVQSVQHSSAPQQQPVAQPISSKVPPLGFPEPWSTFLKRVPEAPKVVWTYMELGLDLGGQADPKRGRALRNIINHLKWPKGTTAFWPVAALTGGTLQPDSQMFWKGWELWRTPYIACFGEEALKVIYPEAEAGSTTCLLEHVTIFVLPPLAKLITMLPHEQQLSIDALTNIRL